MHLNCKNLSSFVCSKPRSGLASSHLKTGVSLVTVLLFMLVATIAATATYKLLTSGGLSSASRMKQQEAHQSALAGIENTRMWMTFHANDVGALIKAFIEGGNKPINLDARVRQWQRAKQDYHVWLTGVNTERSTYKLKILSSGISQILGNTDDANTTVATWNETAIFNVDGLYQVRLLREEPVVEEVVASIPFKYNYFGGSTQSQGHIKAYSLLINGDLFGSNPPYTEDNLIVTGDVHITGNSIGAGGTACIGGNISADNGVFGNDFYVAGDAKKGFTFPAASEAAGLSRAYLTGNVYIEGNIEPPNPGDQKFQKNLTLNGTWTTNLGAHESQVAGNLCFGKNGKVVIDKKNAVRKFIVGGHVWADSAYYPIRVKGPGDNEFEKNEAEYDHIILGNKPESRIYIKSAHSREEYEALVNDRTFVESKDYYKGTSNSAYGIGAARWGDKTTRVYKELPPHLKTKSDAYYLYYYGGLGQDVDYVVSRTGGWGMGFGGTTYYASYYVGNQPFYIPATMGYGATGEKINTLNMSGNTPIGSPYCKATPDKWRPECNVSPWFKSNGNVYRNFTSAQKNFECAEYVKAHCDSVWRKTPGQGCAHAGTSTVNNQGLRSGNADYKVDDILVTAKKKFEEYANRGCRDVTQWGSTMSDRLNRCYRDNTSNPQRAKDSLYNGYQVVKVKKNWKVDPKTPLKGKFIIIVTQPMGQQSLPPTTTDSYVFLYLEQGTGHVNGNTQTLQPAVPNGTYNYFIYTPVDIDGLMFNNEVFSGSIYAKAANCAKVGDIKTRQMVFNEAMMNDLSANAVVCPAAKATEESCGGPVGSSSSAAAEESSASADPSTGSGSTTSEFDSYYISMAPQLSVRLESQGKSKEPVPVAGGSGVTVLNPSFIVLPRIIYLPSDPFGSLPDYYNVQPLNGSTLKKENVTVSCTGPGTLETSSKFYTAGGSKLTQGLYTCTAKATGYSDVPFWVYVGDDSRATPWVSFKSDASGVMGANDYREIKISVPAHAGQITVNFFCPEVDNEGWSYTLGTGVTREGSMCQLKLNASSGTTEPTVAAVTTTDAVDGALVFQLLAGEGYLPGTPSSAELYLASSALLNREEATIDDLNNFCSNNSDCPSNKTNWPDCDISGEWVQPSGTSFANQVVNSSWSIMVGNSSPVTLTAVGNNTDDCLVIIPSSSDFIPAGGVVANQTYSLRASAKVIARTFTVGFKGEVGNNHYPEIKVTVGASSGRSEFTCSYDKNAETTENNEKVMKCTIPIFKGDTVTVALDSLRTTDNENFSFWKCSGGSCPTTDETVSSKKFGTFTITDNETVLLAVFGEADRHCFFDEFKNSSVECENNVIYCIDKCGNDATSVCSSAEVTGIYTQARWHLISGELSRIVTGSSGEIHIDKSSIKKKKQSAREPVVVMSTVNAGILGSLKALINVPRATSSYDKSAVNIKNSGFMLRANTFGNDYFMLNLYENGSGKLEAQLWRGATTLSSVLTNDNGTSVSVSTSRMVLVTADVTASGTVEVSAVVGNYYGDSPTEYKCVFALSEFNNTLADAMHEFVGFSLADPNFKIYGIGWKSETYNSECHDTYPTVKCSFAAVATDGVIKTGVNVEPWVGYSGWFDSRGCSPEYYYYNGNDACNSPGESGATCYDGYYNFSETGAGQHGYTEGDKDIKTAKAWLNCTSTDDDFESFWGISTGDARAHCGAFWTGAFSECTQHEDLFNGSRTLSSGLEETIVLNSKLNLRAATLHITLDNPYHNEVEIWLVSETANWGENDHESHSVQMNASTGMFDVVQEFAADLNGFDPQNVKQIVLKNHGLSEVSLKSITSTCAHAVGIGYCRAEYDGNNWNVTAQITNKDRVSNLQVSATVEGSSHTLEANKNASGDNGILWNGDVAQLNIPDDQVYIEAHQGKHYYFNATITGNGATITKSCSVTPDPIGTIERTCYVPVNSIASGAPYPQFFVDFNGCTGATGCAYELYLDNGGQPFATGSGTSVRLSATGNSVCDETDGCVHTYTVKSPDGKFADCSATFKVLRNQEDAPPTVTCGLSTNNYGPYNGKFFTTDDVYFWARNSESVGATYAMELRENGTSIGSGTLNSWSNHSVISLGKLSATTHTYELFVNGKKVDCDASATVDDLGLNCSVSSTTINKGESVTFRVSWADGMTGQPSDCSMSGSGVPSGGNCYDKWNFNQDITVTPTATGNQNYSYSVKWNNNGTTSDALSCSWTVKVNNAAPTFDCKSNMKAEIGKSDNVTIGLENVTGCNGGVNDCYYEVTDNGVSKITGNSYASGNFDSFTDDNTNSGNKSYSVRLTNSVGNAVKSCTVAFAEGSGCHCTCRSGCDNLSTASQIEGQQNSKHCLFATTITEINENYGKHEILVNGQRPGYCSNNDYSNLCSNKLASIEKVDGGYYIETPATSGNDAWLRVTVGGSRTPYCGGGPSFSCPNNLSYAVNSSVTITPVNVSGCANGCSYTVSSGDDPLVTGNNYTGGALNSFTGSSSTGSQSYTVTLTNSDGSNSENCSVEFTGSASPTITVTKNTDFRVSTTDNVSINISGSETPSNCKMGCRYKGSGQVNMSFTIGTTSSGTQLDFVEMNLNASFCQGGSTSTLRVSHQPADCKMEWW